MSKKRVVIYDNSSEIYSIKATDVKRVFLLFAH